MSDILLDQDNDLRIEDGDFVVGDSTMQEVGLIISTHTGEWKEDPIIGAAPTDLLKKRYSKLELENRFRVHLRRDKKDYAKYKNQIKLLD